MKKGISNSQESSTNRSNLNHGRHIALDVGLLNLAVAAQVNRLSEVWRFESATNETFVDPTGSSQESESEHCKPESAIEDLFRLVGRIQPEDVYWLFSWNAHDVGRKVIQPIENDLLKSKLNSRTATRAEEDKITLS